MTRYCTAIYPLWLTRRGTASLPGCIKVLPFNRPSGLPPLHPTTVTIMQNGTPLSGVSVRLLSKEPSEWPSAGTTDASGKAEIVTYGQFPGVPTGEYMVILSKTESVSKGDGQSGEGGSGGTTEIFSLIAVEHTKEGTSTLQITVNKGKNATTFDVGEPVRVLVDTISPGT